VSSCLYANVWGGIRSSTGGPQGSSARDLKFARVVEEQRGLYRIAGDVEGWAEVSGDSVMKQSQRPIFPRWEIGWASRCDHSRPPGAAERRVARGRGACGGAAGGRRERRHDFSGHAFPEDLNARRLERYLTMVWDAGAVPVVVLNKSDLSEDPQAAADALRARLSSRCRAPRISDTVSDTAVVAVTALQERGLDALEPYLRPSQTIALLGSSGVGKSTLVNRLLGREALKVSAVSDADGRGRHTTTARQLVELPGGALLIDTPGMRELQPLGRRGGRRRSVRRCHRAGSATAGSPIARMTRSRDARCSTPSPVDGWTPIAWSTIAGSGARPRSRAEA